MEPSGMKMERVMNEKAPHKAIDPLRDDPAAILRDTALSDKKKTVALQNWRQDLIELQTATEENMTPTENHAGRLSEQLSRVTEALRTLEEG
jgi:hypothetical protein